MSQPARPDTPTCRVVHAGQPFVGKQGLSYAAAISAETVGSQHIHMQMVTIPPGAKAKAHFHEAHETALYVLSGEAGMWYGEGLAEHMVNSAGDFVYIPAGVPHMPYNPSATETVVAIIARTDPNEQESVVLRPDLDGLRPAAFPKAD